MGRRTSKLRIHSQGFLTGKGIGLERRPEATQVVGVVALGKYVLCEIVRRTS